MNETTETTKSTTLELTINPGYVQDWSNWHAVREILQNALDADQAGFPMTIRRGGGASKTVYITNEGTTLPRSALLLGTSSKDGGGFRGKFGEGLKLALLVLTRKDIAVTVRTGSESWTPYLEKSDQFGATVLKIKVRPASYESKVEIKIHGLSDEDWTSIQEMLLDIPGLPATKVLSDESLDMPVSGGTARILTNPKHKGKLFVRGLYVGKLPDEYSYGYDLPGITLDRDRKMADVWSLRNTISATLAAAISAGKLAGSALLDMFGQDCGEAVAVAYRYEGGWVGSDDLSKAITKAFEEKHGADSTPVATMAESIEAEHHGVKSKMVSKAVKLLVEKEKGDFDKVKKARGMDAKTLFGFGELTTEEQDNLLWAAHLVSLAEPTFTLDQLQVVEFFSVDLCGTGTVGVIGQVRIARRLLTDRRELVATLVHEAAHAWGDDGTISHERKIERMFAEIAVRLSGK